MGQYRPGLSRIVKAFRLERFEKLETWKIGLGNARQMYPEKHINLAFCLIWLTFPARLAILKARARKKKLARPMPTTFNRMGVSVVGHGVHDRTLSQHWVQWVNGSLFCILFTIGWIKGMLHLMVLAINSSCSIIVKSGFFAVECSAAESWIMIIRSSGNRKSGSCPRSAAAATDPGVKDIMPELSEISNRQLI